MGDQQVHWWSLGGVQVVVRVAIGGERLWMPNAVGGGVGAVRASCFGAAVATVGLST